MSLFSGVRRLLGSIKVTQDQKEIHISGLPANVVTRDIAKIWKTSRINTHLFTKVTNNQLSFPLFFAPDILYMLEKMTEHRSTNANVRTLTKIKHLLLEHTWLKDTQVPPVPRITPSKLGQFHYRPLDYQQRFFDEYDQLTQQYHLKGYVLAAAAGSGKSFMGLALAEQLQAQRIVVISPKNAIERVWESEVINLYKGKHPSYWVYAHGRPYKNERVAIFHYEALAAALSMIAQLKQDRTMVILDESHNLNEISSQRTQNFIRLCRDLDATDVIWASGTAVKSMGAELIPMLRTIDPFFTPEVEVRYKAIYGRDGNRGMDILNHRMGLISYKVEKRELGLDKPIIKELRVKIPNGQDYTLDAIRQVMQAFIAERYKYYASRKTEDYAFYDRCLALHGKGVKGGAARASLAIYEEDVKLIRKYNGDTRVVAEEIRRANHYEKHFILPSLPKEDRHRFKDVKSIVKYLGLKIQGEALGQVLGRKRIECHVDMIPGVDFEGICNSTPKKTVVFTSFVEALEASQSHLTARGMTALVVYGKTNNELAANVKRFGDQEDLNPLIATYHSLSTAVPLVMADTLIMLNAPFRSYIHEQAISRVHRLGSDTQVMVWEVRLDTGDKPNISTRSGDILAWSQDMVQQIMGISSPYMDIESLEHHDDPVDIDPHALLLTTFEHYDITLPSLEDYRVTIARSRSQPIYWAW